MLLLQTCGCVVKFNVGPYISRRLAHTYMKKMLRTPYEMRKPPSRRIELTAFGNGKMGSPRSLAITSSNRSYLFNIGEGSSRVAEGSRMKFSKLEHVFFTHMSWTNLGGAVGYVISFHTSTLDNNRSKLRIHGPPNVEKLFHGSKQFCNLENIVLGKREISEGGFEDATFKFEYVPLYPIVDKTTDSKLQKMQVLEQDANRTDVSVVYICKPKPMTRKIRLHRCLNRGLPTDIGRFEYVGRLQEEKDLIMEDGSLVRANDVLESSFGDMGSIVVIECPTEAYIEALEKNERLQNLEDLHCVVHFTPCDIMKTEGYQAWMKSLGPSVKHILLNDHDQGHELSLITTLENQVFMHQLHSDLFPLLYQQKHLSQTQGETQVETEGETMGKVLRETQIETLREAQVDRQLEADTMRKIRETQRETIEILGDSHVETLTRLHLETQATETQSETFRDTLPHTHTYRRSETQGETKQSPTHVHRHSHSDTVTQSIRQEETQVETHLETQKFIYGGTKMSYIYRDGAINRGLSREECPNYDWQQCYDRIPEQYLHAEKMQQLKEYQNALLAGQGANTDKGKYPEVIFLGTGSSKPSHHRNVSGILVQISKDKYLLLDCGEGTYGQMLRFYGEKETARILRHLRGVFVSHLHGDHHIGVPSILEAREAALSSEEREEGVEELSEEEQEPVYVLAPKKYLIWLNLIYQKLITREPNYRFVSLEALLGRNNTPSNSQLRNVCRTIGLQQFNPVRVIHSMYPFGIVLTTKAGYKMVYSGDTRPCEDLIAAGKNCDLLIHEATVADPKDAFSKRHSTIQQAIEVGAQMRAKYTMLTHVSQRYGKSDNDPSAEFHLKQRNYGIAFDFMRVTPALLPVAASLVPVVKHLFMGLRREDYPALIDKEIDLILNDAKPRSAKKDRIKKRLIEQ